MAASDVDPRSVVALAIEKCLAKKKNANGACVRFGLGVRKFRHEDVAASRSGELRGVVIVVRGQLWGYRCSV